MRQFVNIRIIMLITALGLPLVLASPALAADANVAQVENFLKSVIQIVSGLAGLIATGFFVAGGLGYITSSGNADRMGKSKQTLIYSGIGLAIVIGAFVISNIVTGIATNAFGS